MDDDVQDLLRVEGCAHQRILDGDKEFLLTNLAGAETVGCIGFNDAVQHQSQIHIPAQVVVERLLALRIDTRVNVLSLADFLCQCLDGLEQFLILQFGLLILFQQAVDAFREFLVLDVVQKNVAIFSAFPFVKMQNLKNVYVYVFLLFIY